MHNITHYLDQTFAINKKIDELSEVAKDLRHRTASPVSGIAGGTGVQKTRNNHYMQDLVARFIEAEHEIAEAKSKLLAIESRIHKISRTLPPSQRAVVILRYICQSTWAEIAQTVDVSEMQARRFHAAAIDALIKESFDY